MSRPQSPPSESQAQGTETPPGGPPETETAATPPAASPPADAPTRREPRAGAVRSAPAAPPVPLVHEDDGELPTVPVDPRLVAAAARRSDVLLEVQVADLTSAGLADEIRGAFARSSGIALEDLADPAKVPPAVRAKLEDGVRALLTLVRHSPGGQRRGVLTLRRGQGDTMQADMHDGAHASSTLVVGEPPKPPPKVSTLAVASPAAVTPAMRSTPGTPAAALPPGAKPTLPEMIGGGPTPIPTPSARSRAPAGGGVVMARREPPGGSGQTR